MKLINILRKFSTCTPQRTPCASIRKINRLILCTEVMAIFAEKYIKIQIRFMDNIQGC
jgi:hypothetical protein